MTRHLLLSSVCLSLAACTMATEDPGRTSEDLMRADVIDPVPRDEPPDAPSGLVVRKRGPSSVELDFGCSDDEVESYRARRRRPGDDTYEFLATHAVSSGRCRVVDTTVQAERRYCYDILMSHGRVYRVSNEACTATDSAFEYRMPERSEISHAVFDSVDGTYPSAYVNPEVWHVELDACRYGYLAERYVWEVEQADGRTVRYPSSTRCSRRVGLHVLGPTRVTLHLQRGRFVQTKRKTIHPKDHLVVSLGDSYAAGQGIPDVPGEYVLIDDDNGIEALGHGIEAVEITPASWLDATCNRSRFGAHADAARRLEQLDHHSSVTFLSYACSGAKTPDILHESQHPNRTPQLDRAVDDTCSGSECRDVDTVLLTIGGNDVGFSKAITFCAAGDAIEDAVADPLAPDSCPPDAGDPYLDRVFGLLASNYDQLDRALEGRLSPTKTVITEYPVHFFEDEDRKVEVCGHFRDLPAHMEDKEARWLMAVGNVFNREIAAHADRLGWTLVTGIDAAFRGRGYCTPSYRRYFVQHDESWEQQGEESGMLHPTFEGASAMAQLIAPALFPPRLPETTYGDRPVMRFSF